LRATAKKVPDGSRRNMRKIILLAAALALVVALLGTASVSADTLGCSADLSQSNVGSQYAINVADQTANATQNQYNGAGGADQYQYGGDAGLQLQDQSQYQNQSQVQDATATGPTFSATQTQDCSNTVVKSANLAAV